MADPIGLAILATIEAVTALSGPSVIAGGTALTGVTVFGISLPTIVGTTAIVGVSLGISYALRPKPPKPDDGMQSKKLGVSARIGGYGRCRISGTYVLYETAATDERSIDIVALLSGKIANFKNFMLNDDVVTIDAFGVVQPGVDGRYGQSSLTIEKRDGSDSQTAYGLATSLLPGVWTTDHKGNGIASLELACIAVGTDKFQTVYPNGLPEPGVLADLYALWDFRDAGQDPTNPATWTAPGGTPYPTWSSTTTYIKGARVLYQGVVYISAAAANLNNIPDVMPSWWANAWQNPVLQLIDYMTHPDHGMALNRDRLISATVKAALITEANYCDEQVMTKSGLTEPRYRSCGTFDFSTMPEGVIGAILASCDGWLAENGDGTIALQVGVYRAPTVTIDMKHIVGFGVQYGVGDEELVNVMPITISSPDFGYRETPCEPWRDDASVALAGIERSRSLDLNWVQSFPQARRLAKKAMLRQQCEVKGNVVVDLYGLAALGERYLILNYPVIAGLESAVVEVQNIKVDFAGGKVAIDWVKIDPTKIDAWNPATEEGTPPPVPPEVAPAVMPVPQNVAVYKSGSVYGISFTDIGRTDFTYLLFGEQVDAGTGTYGGGVTIAIPTVSTSGGVSSFAIPSTYAISPTNPYRFKLASVSSKRTVSDYSAFAYAEIEAETAAIRDRMTPPPSTTRLSQMNAVVAACKSAGAWTLFDGFYVLAGHAQAPSLINWKQNAYNLTIAGTPSFTIDRGFDNMTTTAYLDTGFLCDTSPRVMALNDASLGVWLGENVAVDSYDAGTAAGSSQLWLQARTVAGNFVAAVNAATGVSVANTDSTGHFVATRAASGTVTLYRNGASLGAPASTSTALVPVRNLYFGGMNNGAPAASSGRLLRVGHFGRSLSAAQVTAVRNALNTYLTAIGATP